MCGIVGGFYKNNQISEAGLFQIVSVMAHRGPDEQGVYKDQSVNGKVHLGHCRLRVIDVKSVFSQPFHLRHLHLVFNGEIFNYPTLRSDLIRLGHQFHTQSDTEVLLHSWQEWGEAAIEKWHGMFAVVIYDEEKQELICIRDRAGVKPLYYYHHDGLFLFGSELKSLLAHPGFVKQIDPNAVACYMQYGYVPAPHSIYQQTYKLQPGHLLRLDLRSGTTQVRQYWNVTNCYSQPKLDIDFSTAKVETERVLQKAFDLRMVADVPVGLFLSGGYDSTCVAALLQKDRTERIRTFTIGTTDALLDEAPYAKEIAKHLDTDHTEYYCSPKEAQEIIPELPYYFDEPFADSSAIPTMLVSRLARKEVTVALSADGGDEIFAGYNRYDYLHRYGRKLNAIPTFLRKGLVGAMSKFSSSQFPLLSKQPLFHSRYHKVRNLLRDPSPKNLLRNMSHVFADWELSQLMACPVQPLVTAFDTCQVEPPYDDPLSCMMAVDYQNYLTDDILQKVDRATMAASLEGREPFLDQSIIEWAARLPNEFKYHKGEKKYILKQIVHQYVPARLMDRPKMGFGIPIAQWLGNELRPLLEDYLSEKALHAHGLFCSSYVQQVKRDFLSGRTELHLKIWYLLAFQMWYRQWMQ